MRPHPAGLDRCGGTTATSIRYPSIANETPFLQRNRAKRERQSERSMLRPRSASGGVPLSAGDRTQAGEPPAAAPTAQHDQTRGEEERGGGWLGHGDDLVVLLIGEG